MRTYSTRRSGLRVLAYLVGHSFLIRDPFASTAVFAQKPPGNSTMSLTVPEMRRVDHVPVYTGGAGDKGALHDGMLHLKSTGFPWQTGVNVYIAGHRMGFPGTKSYLVFWDLNRLEHGDKVILADANGSRYTYSVFKSTIINLDAYYITRPVPGKSIISLQTCTLPNYAQRLIVQAELTAVG